jgi:hypothetical protein
MKVEQHDGFMSRDLPASEMNELFEWLDVFADLVENGLAQIVGVNDEGLALYAITESGREWLAKDDTN